MHTNFKIWIASGICIVICGCTAAKLEARMEANPQCKEIVNTKTGLVMPCPGTEKSFYRSVGLESPKPSAPISIVSTSGSSIDVRSAPAGASAPSIPVVTTTKSAVPIDCKPQLHKKTGGLLPCPSPD